MKDSRKSKTTAKAAKLFRERLIDRRAIRRLTQAQLANKADLTPSAISQFETGTRLPSFHNLRRLCKALHVRSDYLLGLHE